MVFKHYLPSAHLQPIVEYYLHHTQTFDHASYGNLYSTPILECLVFNFNSGVSTKMEYGGTTYNLTGQMHLFGQPILPGSIEGNYNDYIVVKLKPLGIWRLTGISMHHIANKIISAEDIFGTPLQRLVEQMQETQSTHQRIAFIEKFLQSQIEKKKKGKEHTCVEWTLNILGNSHGNSDVKTLQKDTNTSRKTLERAFINQLGILPKLYSRIVRYNFAKAHIEKTGRINLQIIIDQQGYYDQSHFINEFKFFSGKTPYEYYNYFIDMSDNLSMLLSPDTLKSE